MRIASGLLTVVFLVAAAVQWNDPDRLVWILAYLVAAGLSGAAAVGRIVLWPNVIAAGCFGVGFLLLAPSLVDADPAAFDTFRMQQASHEEPREALGLALAAGWTGALAVQAVRRKVR